MRQQLTSRPRPARPHAPAARRRLDGVRLGGVPLAAVLAGALALTLATPARAQSVLGAGASAFVLPRGVLRIGVDQSWSNYDETFGAQGDSGTARAALGARFSSTALGAAELPSLAPVQRDLQQLTGQPALALSLGRTVVSASASSRVTAIDLEAGLGAGLAVGVVVPIVRTQSTVGVDVNDGAVDANVGLNPARFGGTAASAAVAANGALAAQFAAASQRLRAQYASCFTATGGATGAAGCADVVAFYESATAYATTLARTYGTTAGRGAAVVPLRGSAAQRAVDASVASYNARFAALLGSAGPLTGAVQGAVPATSGDYQALLTDPAGGFAYDTLRTRSRIGVGDVEVGVRLKLIDTFRGREAGRLAPAGLNLRTTVAGTYRFGTGRADSPSNLTDVATGDGQNDVEVASLTDLVFGSRGWLSLVARYGRQLADELPVRVPFAGSGTYLPAFTLQTVQRDLGDFVQFEATPRVALGSAIAFEAQYRFRRTQADRYAGTFTVTDTLTGTTAVPLDAAVLGANSEREEQRVGGAVTYSTYGAHGRRRARIPLELSLGYLRTIGGRGGAPAGGTTRLQLRAFPRLFGRDWRAPVATARP